MGARDPVTTESSLIKVDDDEESQCRINTVYNSFAIDNNLRPGELIEASKVSHAASSTYKDNNRTNRAVSPFTRFRGATSGPTSLCGLDQIVSKQHLYNGSIELK